METMNKEHKPLSPWWLILAFVIPFAGFIIGIVAFWKGEIGKGFATWAIAWVGFLVNLAIVMEQGY